MFADEIGFKVCFATDFFSYFKILMIHTHNLKKHYTDSPFTTQSIFQFSKRVLELITERKLNANIATLHLLLVIGSKILFESEKILNIYRVVEGLPVSLYILPG